MPTNEQVQLAVATIQKLKANYTYFFANNQSPDWIQPLRAHGYFKHPPTPEPVGDLVRFPPWPESQYLVRMAPKAPDLVASVLAELPKTENIYVHADIVDAARAMPGSLAARLAKNERKWIRSQKWLFWLLPDRYADLVVYLANQGEANAAFDLAMTLLEVSPDPRATQEEEPRFGTPEPVARMDHWDYQRAIEKCLAILTRVDGLRALRLFAGLLETAMNSAEPPRDGDYSDHSYIWRPAVEDHTQNEPEHSIRDALVAATRDAAEALVRGDLTKASAVVNELEGRKRSIFQRIALHTLALYGASALDLATVRLADWALFDEINVRHEYVRLAQAHFKDLSEEQVEELLRHLNTPPTMDNYRVNYAAMFGRVPSSEEVEQAKIGWQIEKLAALRGLLPERWQRRYEDLLADRPGPKHPDFPAYMESGYIGPNSPKSSQDIAALAVDELIDFLRSWKPSGDPFDASPEGLGRQLASAVEADPPRFGRDADRFKDLEPTYVRSVLDGFESAVRADQSFSWPKVLDLAEQVVGHPFELDIDADGTGLGERDPGWRWARGSVANLLQEAFNRDRMPFGERDRAWSILRRVTEDPNPSPAHEARYGGSNMDPLTLSLNTNRGKAMQAVVRYALWVRRNDERLHPERLASGFGAMPEVREVLDSHLDAATDPSVAIRAVYGQWFPWLALIDPIWARENAGRIFPGSSAPELSAAAWESYLTNSPYDTPFEILRPQYEAAVEQLPRVTAKNDRRSLHDPSEHLAEHLMILLIRGRVALDDGLVKRFFEIAPEKIRLHALVFIGQLLRNNEAPALTVAQSERLEALWQMRFAAFEADPEKHKKEVGAFGWWFASPGKLPEDWLMARLLEVVGREVPVDYAHGVIERLADLAPKQSYEAIRALRLMVPIQEEPGLLVASREATRRLISAAATSNDARARKEASELLNELAARGYSDFDDLARDLTA